MLIEDNDIFANLKAWASISLTRDDLGIQFNVKRTTASNGITMAKELQLLLSNLRCHSTYPNLFHFNARPI